MEIKVLHSLAGGGGMTSQFKIFRRSESKLSPLCGFNVCCDQKWQVSDARQGLGGAVEIICYKLFPLLSEEQFDTTVRYVNITH